MWKGYLADVFSQLYMSATVPAAATTVTDFVGPVPEGYCWYVERETIWSNTAAASPVYELYVINGQTAPADSSKAGRQDVALGTQVNNAASDLAAPIYVGPGQSLVAVWSGMTAADKVAASFQIRSHRLVEADTHSHAFSHHAIEGGESGKLPELVLTGDVLTAV